MVGDRLDTDIQLAVNSDIASCMVLTGCSKREEIQDVKPTFVLDSIRNLLNV
jgi:ribonucleotide monophosphatase NagD (HAD superfamily)